MTTPYIIAISNQKGGVAKTTTVVSLGGALVNLGKEVLLVDLDPQANLTLALGKDPARVRSAVTEVFFNAATLLSASRETSIPGLDLVPSNAGMELAERFLPLRKNYEFILRQSLNLYTQANAQAGEQPASQPPQHASLDELPVNDSSENIPSEPKVTTSRELSAELEASLTGLPEAESEAFKPPNLPSSHPYDFIIFDCPPFIGAVTLNAITASDMLIIPTQPEYFSAHALRTMMAAVKQVRSAQNPRLVYRILITMLDRRNRIHRQVSEQIRQTFGTAAARAVFTTAIEVDTKLRESAVEGLPITHHKSTRQARSALQYQALAQELIDYVETKAQATPR